jgi:DNA-binding transcriptional ArsR family regulator
MDHIFKALANPTRQKLLDALRLKDGQTRTDLESSLDMTRFGAMKHLKLLEDANLIFTRKSGRFKYHYLNAVPPAGGDGALGRAVSATPNQSPK